MKFYLVVTPAVEAVTEKFDTVEDLIKRLQQLRKDEAELPVRNRCFIFEGNRILTSKGEPKYLIMPDGSNLPIEQPVPELIEDMDGLLTEPTKFQIPNLPEDQAMVSELDNEMFREEYLDDEPDFDSQV